MGRPPRSKKVTGRRGTGRSPAAAAAGDLRTCPTPSRSGLLRLHLQVADHGPRRHPGGTCNLQMSSTMSVKRKSEDIGWDYGVLVDPTNLNLIKCKLCGHIVSAGIFRLKVHIAGIRGQVKPCSHSNEEDKERCKKAIDDLKQVKKARLARQQEVRDIVGLVDAPEVESDQEET
ncbi:unnamed protein product [Urochloa humidicola]